MDKKLITGFLLGIIAGLLISKLEQATPTTVTHSATIAKNATVVKNVTVIKEVKPSKEQFLHALWQVEASGELYPSDGDNGNAIGPYQIWKVYWLDAVEFSGLGGSYEDCRDIVYAEQVIHKYMKRHARDAWESGDWETVARIHNGGPNGATKTSTVKYWKKVEEHLNGI